MPMPPAGPSGSSPTPTCVQPCGHQRLPRLVERWLRQIAGRRPCTVTGHQAARRASATGRGRRRRGASLVEHAATSTAMPSSPAPIRLCRSQTRMHLPDQDLRGLGRGDALAAGCGEPDGVAFVQRPAPSSVTSPRGTNRCRYGACGSSTAVAWLQSRAVQCRVAVVDGDGGVVAVLGHARRDGHQSAAQQLVVDLGLLVAGRRCRIRRALPTSARNALARCVFRRRSASTSRSSPNAGCRGPPTSAAPGRGRSRPECPVESWCTSDPCSTHVTISMSRCGMGVKPGARLDDVVVVDQQQPVVGVRPGRSGCRTRTSAWSRARRSSSSRGRRHAGCRRSVAVMSSPLGSSPA